MLLETFVKKYKKKNRESKLYYKIQQNNLDCNKTQKQTTKTKSIFFFTEIVFNCRKIEDVSTTPLWWPNAPKVKFQRGNNIPFEKRNTGKAIQSNLPIK